jgi:hypothetical protein
MLRGHLRAAAMVHFMRNVLGAACRSGERSISAKSFAGLAKVAILDAGGPLVREDRDSPSEKTAKLKRCNIPFLALNKQGAYATAIAWVDGIVERTQERGIYARQALIALENNACHRTAFVMAQDPTSNTDFDSVRNEIEKLLTALSGQVHIREQTLREITVQWHEELASRAERLKREGFRFGIPSVDLALGPIPVGSYVVISAETSGGKSLFAFQGALHAARQGVPVAAFSLEMTDHQLLDRMFAHLCRVSMNSFREGLFRPEELNRLNTEITRFVDLPLYLGQTRGNDIAAIASKLRRLKVKHGIKVAVVDYLQRAPAPPVGTVHGTWKSLRLATGLKASHLSSNSS